MRTLFSMPSCVSGPILGGPGRETSLSPEERVPGLEGLGRNWEVRVIPDASSGQVGVVSAKMEDAMVTCP